MTELTTLLETTLGVPFVAGNSIEVLRNGDEIFPSMLEAIGNAQRSVDLVTYVYWTGDIAIQFANTLAGRARNGVNVRVLLDAFGCKRMNLELVAMMQDAGVEIRWFRPLARWKIWKIDNRTHRKLMVCDYNVAFTGGVGIAAEWTGDARNPSEWRDTHFRIAGPVVNTMHSGFLSNWSEAGDGPDLPIEYPEPPAPAGVAAIQVIRSPSSVNWSDIAMLFRLLITKARQSVHITTAYFAPDQLLTDYLCRAAKRGVSVTLLVPGKHSDERLSQLGGEYFFRQLLDAGVSICLYNRTMLHVKILLVDAELAVVGSANMNHRSMSKDEELCLVIDDKQTVAKLANHYREDLDVAEPLNLEEWHDRSVWQRAGELISRPFRAEL